MPTIIMLLTLCGLIAASLSAPTIYDQKQTGDLNVQVDLKNVQVIALLDSDYFDDYTDYNYFYDYADFTIRPSSRPTTSSSTAELSTEKNSVTEIAEPVSSQNSTVSAILDYVANSTDIEMLNANLSNGTTNSTSDVSGSDKNQSSEAQESESEPVDLISWTTVLPSTTSKSVQALRSRKRCKSGYIPTGNGRCRRGYRRWLSLSL